MQAMRVVVLLRLLLPEKMFDRCVTCGAITESLRDDPIAERPTYVEGAGQLCRKCAEKLYVLAQ